MKRNYNKVGNCECAEETNLPVFRSFEILTNYVCGPESSERHQGPQKKLPNEFTVFLGSHLEMINLVGFYLAPQLPPLPYSFC